MLTLQHGRPYDYPRPQRLARMFQRLSLPGLASLAVGLAAFVAEFRYAYMSERLNAVGLSGIGTILGYSLGVLGILVGLQQIATKALSHGKTATLIRSRVFFPIEGRVYLVMMTTLFIGAVIGRSNPMLLVFCLMATPWVFNGFIAFTQLRSISVARQVPERAEAGQVIPITVLLTNKRRLLPVWMFTVRDEIDGPNGNGPRMKRPLKPQAAFLRVPKNESQRRVYRVRLPRRGEYEFGPMQANTRFPLGLIERGLVIPNESRILIYPRIGSVSPSWRRRISQTQEQVTRSVARAGSFEDDFHRVREYQTGDDPRAIHWPTSARRGALVVREFRESRDRPLALLVDLWSATNETTRAVDLALDLAASLAVDHSRTSQRSSVFCAISGASFSEWDSSSRADLGGLLDRMAIAEASNSGHMDVLANSWKQRGQFAERVVLITTRREPVLPMDLPTDAQLINVQRDPIDEICVWPDA